MPFTNYDGETCRNILNTLWKNSLIGLAIVDKDGVFIKANTAFCEFVEYSEAELIGNAAGTIRGKTFQEITLPDDVEFDKEMMRRVLAGEINTYDMSKRYLTKFHKIVKVLLRATGVMKQDEFMFFIAQASLLEPPTTMTIKVRKEQRRFRFWQAIRTNWTIIVFVIAVLGAIMNDTAKEALALFK